MDLFRTIIFEFVLGYIMQAFVFILGIYAFNRKKISCKSYIFVGIIVSVVYYLVRLLPISFGIHTIISLLLLFLVSIFILKMPIYSTIRSTLFVTVLLLASEMANVAIMINILGQDEFERRMSVPLEKALVGFPGALSFAVLIIILYLILTRTKKEKYTKK